MSAFPSQEPAMRAYLLAIGADPDALWCPRCSTALEDLRDGLEVAGPAILRTFALVASLVPGVGTGVAFALGAAASLAEGNEISAAMVDAAAAAVPAGQVARVPIAAAAETGAALARGVDVDEALLRGAREAARQVGGNLAAAAFDAVVAISQGKTLQDAGFAGLKAFARGNTIAERGIEYSRKIAAAARAGRELVEVLTEDLRGELLRLAGPGRALVGAAVDRIAKNPALLALGSDALAELLAVPEPVARAGQAILRSGRFDGALFDGLTRSASASLIERFGEATIASRSLNLSWSELAAAERSDVLELAARMDPSSLSYRTAVVLETGGELVGASRPAQAPRSGTLSDVALGALVVSACGALVWWARSS